MIPLARQTRRRTKDVMTCIGTVDFINSLASPSENVIDFCRVRAAEGPRVIPIHQVKARGLHGVEFVVADHHAGLRGALREVLAEAAYQRCYVHFLRNALDYVPRRVDYDCLHELRRLGACPRAGEAAPGGGATSPKRAVISKLPAGSKKTSTRP